MSAGWTIFDFRHVFVKARVTCYKLDCCYVVLSVFNKRGCEVVHYLGIVATKDHLNVLWTIFGPVLVVELHIFVFNVVIDIRLGYRTSKERVAGAGNAKLS